MAHEESDSRQSKISPAFNARLGQLDPEDEVRAIVLLRAEHPGGPPEGRPSRAARKEKMRSVRDSLSGVLPDIDLILKRHRGKRLASRIDALGAVPVVTTAAGINALAASEHVKAIIEDQGIYSKARA
jgi:hypothetical protein